MLLLRLFILKLYNLNIYYVRICVLKFIRAHLTTLKYGCNLLQMYTVYKNNLMFLNILYVSIHFVYVVHYHLILYMHIVCFKFQICLLRSNGKSRFNIDVMVGKRFYV